MKNEIVCMGYIFYKDKILLVKHKKTNKYMSCGGHLKNGETFIECLIREIKEETNLDVEITSINTNTQIEKPIPFSIVTKEIKNKKLLILEYLCETKDISKLKINDKELIDYIWISEDHLETFNTRDTQKEILKNAFKTKKTK